MIIENFWSLYPELKENIAKQNHFSNNDELLREKSEAIKANRRTLGLEELVGDLQFLLVNTEMYHLEEAVQEFLDFTGHDVEEAFEDEWEKRVVLRQKNSADFIIRARKKGKNPHVIFNLHPKTGHLPNTRIEAFVFQCKGIHKYYEIQRKRGVQFLEEGIVETEHYFYLQTVPSAFTGTSYGVIEWKDEEKKYCTKDSSFVNIGAKKTKEEYVKNIQVLDHAATRIHAKDRDAAILELMEITNYNFDFAIYVPSMNSITNVARLPKAKFAMVFTAGIEPFVSLEKSGPTEKFVYNYGPRVHHLAFHTEHIEHTFEILKDKGMKFLIELVGGEEEGLKQTFSYPSAHTFIVNEYIYRYGDFDGFFTRSNVADLTASTSKQ